MQNLAEPYEQLNGRSQWRSYIPTGLAILVVLFFAAVFDRQNFQIFNQQQRSDVQMQGNLIRSRLEGVLNADIQLVKGLTAILSAHPITDQQEYGLLAEQVIGGKSEFINLAAAPDLVVSLVYPYEANKAALGLDYRANDAQRDAAFRVRDTGEIILAGPVNLVQGGTGFIIRFPVFTEQDGPHRFWGIVSAVLDVELIYAASGISDPTHNLDIALIGEDGSGAAGGLFYGDPQILQDRPVLVDVVLPTGTWQMAVRPAGGWLTTPENLWWNRALYVLAGLLIVIPTFIAGRISVARKSALRTLRARETELKRLSLVARYASDSIILTDPETNILWVNAAFERMTGHSADEALGRKPGDLLNSDLTDPETIDAINSHKKRGIPFKTEVLNQTKSGDQIWVETNIVPVRAPSGEVTMIVAIERDVTQEKAHKQELAEAKSVAEMADRAKSDFLANMSHEIRTPMNGIIGMADLLAEADLPDENHQCVEVIQSSSHALLKIINDILDLSRLEAGRVEILPGDFNLRNCIDNIIDLLEPGANEKDLILQCEVSADVPDMVRTDEGRLRQILVNLIGNAIKFTESGSVSVRIASSDTDPYRVSIEVEDTGIGIADEKLAHVFDRFSQEDAATTRMFGGTGLGLTISDVLARLLGGRISVRSEQGKGSCFEVTLQTAPPLDQQHARPKRERSPDFLQGVSILMAEDNATNRLLIRRYLEGTGAELIETVNGHDAAETCLERQPDIVLMDMAMPVLDGLAATRRIRGYDINQPCILALTANAFASDLEACLDAGMDDVLTKPINKSTLLDRLYAVVSTSEPMRRIS